MAGIKNLRVKDQMWKWFPVFTSLDSAGLEVLIPKELMFLPQNIIVIPIN